MLTSTSPSVGPSVSVEREALLKALSHQQSLIEKRTSVPILSHVHLEAKPGALSLTGTDLEISLVETIPADTHTEGKTTVSVHTLRDIVRKLPDKAPINLTVNPEGHGLTLRSVLSEFVLPTLPASDFPPVHPQELPHRFTLSSHVFRSLIEDTRFAMSTEEARYFLNGIYFHREQDQWRAVATDAHRLALSWASLPLNSDLPGVIIGKKTIQELSKLLEESPEEVTLSLSNNQLLLSFDNVLFSSRLVEGQFPDYWEAIPKNHPHQVVLDVRAFAQAIDRVGMVSSENHRLIKLAFQPGQLLLSANSQQYGSGFEQMTIDYGGQDIALGFNPRYVLDICNHIKGEKVILFLKDNASPTLFLDPENQVVTYVLMPMRI